MVFLLGSGISPLESLRFPSLTMPERNVVCYDVEGNTGGGWDDEASNPTKQRRVYSCVRIVEPRMVLSSFVKEREILSLRFVER